VTSFEVLKSCISGKAQGLIKLRKLPLFLCRNSTQEITMRKQFLPVAIAVFLSITISACANKGPRPDSELALAGSALESAELSGARQYAPIKLRNARKKHDDANKAMQEEKFKKARYLSIEARADAELARAAAETEKTRQELQRAQEALQAQPVKTVPAANPR